MGIFNPRKERLMKAKINETVAKNVQATGKQYYVIDTQISNFAIRVSKRGTGTFVYRSRKMGYWRDTTIGRVGSVTAKEAKAIATKLLFAANEEKKSEGLTLDTRPSQLTFAEAIEERLHEMAIKNYQIEYFSERKMQNKYWPKHLIDTRNGLEKAEKYFGKNTSIKSISYRDVNNFHLNVTPKSSVGANRYLSYLSGVFNHAIKLGEISSNPCQLVTKNRERSTKLGIPEPMISAFFKQLDLQENQNVADTIRFAILSGCRTSEIFSLESNQFSANNYVDWEENALILNVNKASSRTGKPSVRYLTPYAMAILHKHRKRRGIVAKVFCHEDGSAIKPADFIKMFNEIRDVMFTGDEHKNITPYCTRHTFSQMLARENIDKSTVAELMGISDVRLLDKVYARSITSAAKRARELASKVQENLLNKVFCGY